MSLCYPARGILGGLFKINDEAGVKGFQYGFDTPDVRSMLRVEHALKQNEIDSETLG